MCNWAYVAAVVVTALASNQKEPEIPDPPKVPEAPTAAPTGTFAPSAQNTEQYAAAVSAARKRLGKKKLNAAKRGQLSVGVGNNTGTGINSNKEDKTNSGTGIGVN